MESANNFAFLLPVMMLIFGCTFLIVGRFGSREAKLWGPGYLVSAAAFSMPLIVGFIPDRAASLIADLLFLISFVFYSGALLCRFGRPSSLMPRLAFIGAMYAGILYAALVAESVPIEFLLDDLGCVLLLAFAIVMSLRRVRHTADKALLTASALVVAETVIRNAVFVFIAPSYGGSGGFLASNYAFAMQAGASIPALVFALSALAAATLDTIAAHRDAAERDPLTGLLNRRGFDRMVEESRGAEGTVIICDIDNFKWVNDTFGHGRGDDVIRAFAEMLRLRLPEGGFAARFGGEEFVIFLPSAPLVAGADFANRVRLAFAAIDRKAIGFDGKVTASFGVAAANAADHSLYEQIARADKALYAAKEAGRNKVMVEGEPPHDMSGPRLYHASEQHG
ncbi:diguanylate cyclase (GGDEF)-like protein [Rhizobium sp. BK650]|uniref:GGDEF domain-containing protein n=1 Tax=Rhizobium sp. BK650 TaxID=2586990 RepID=UPI001616A5A3|nr:GGDEF domain-containing protein [Rhizobium sp. BK650]MBB3656851.1 diguanylate cyclase (GGDEF)-like protein [Rhizobium sp. BK650]